MPHASTGMAGGEKTGITDEMQKCIDACTACHRICLETLKTCLSMGGPHAAAEHITLLSDCAQICATSADFMSRGSGLHHLTCRACTEICAACAESCHGLGGPEMEACAAECERCAASCARMSGQTTAAH